ncbi:MAG: hypothetical protein ACI9SC_000346 [Gammaproteobacteria bacterium]
MTVLIRYEKSWSKINFSAIIAFFEPQLFI